MEMVIAFLRGINVGGHKIIKMEELQRIFSSFGFNNVRTYIQSGNVVFDADYDDSGKLLGKIEKGLFSSLGYEVDVCLRTTAEIGEIIASDPFGKYKKEPDSKFYVAFLKEKPPVITGLPLYSPKKDMEIFRVSGREAYIVSRKIEGAYGFPNNYLEHTLGSAATTRNWNTVCKIFDFAGK